jgi:hypothetical protein
MKIEVGALCSWLVAIDRRRYRDVCVERDIVAHQDHALVVTRTGTFN